MPGLSDILESFVFPLEGEGLERLFRPGVWSLGEFLPSGRGLPRVGPWYPSFHWDDSSPGAYVRAWALGRNAKCHGLEGYRRPSGNQGATGSVVGPKMTCGAMTRIITVSMGGATFARLMA